MRMMNLLAAVVIGASLAAGPATQPATRPTTRAAGPDVAELRRAVWTARDAVTRAKAQAAKRAEARPEYEAAATELAARERALEVARATGTAQQKLDASAAAAKARAAAAAVVADAVARDDAVARAEAAVVAAQAAVARGDDEAKRAAAAAKEADAAAEAGRMKDPIYRAMKEGRVAVGMTLEQANAAMKSEAVLKGESEGGEASYEWYSKADAVQGPRGLIVVPSSLLSWARTRDGRVVACGRVR